MSRVSSRIGGVELEALAQIDHRDGAAAVGHHALQELGGLGQRGRGARSGGCARPEGCRRRTPGGPPGRSPPGCRRRCSCGSASPMNARAQRGQIEQWNQSVRHAGRPPTAQGKRRYPAEPEAPGSLRTILRVIHLQAEPPAVDASTRIAVAARSSGHGGAVEQGAEVDHRNDAPMHRGDAAHGGLDARAPGAPRRSESPRPHAASSSPTRRRAGPHQENQPPRGSSPAHPAQLARSIRRGDLADRKRRGARRRPAGPRRASRRSSRSPGPGRSRFRRHRGSGAAPRRHRGRCPVSTTPDGPGAEPAGDAAERADRRRGARPRRWAPGPARAAGRRARRPPACDSRPAPRRRCRRGAACRLRPRPPEPALGRQPLGQAPGELRRHVLHDEHRRIEPGRQLRHDLRQGARAAGRGRDGDAESRAPGTATSDCGRERSRAGGAPAPAAG